MAKKPYAEGPADYNSKPPAHSGAPTKVYPASSKLGHNKSGKCIEGPASDAPYAK